MGNVNINHAIQNVASKTRNLYPPVERKDGGADKFHSATTKTNLSEYGLLSEMEGHLFTLSQQWVGETQADQIVNDADYTQVVVIGDFVYVIRNRSGVASAPEFIRTVRVNPEVMKENIAATKAQ